ncbi:hypothetical protein GC088_02415 [Arthrobacter sp. JZ12]|uniref:hypothetical protein n=1 Tax=Arthrobacter sp. JZ12 TaxID=2654190 RepID=UPI002B4A8D8A|nr:hypothetical protein [Arthrobacter sp. JZ12]WRH24066.1 hypothetical protein GC088_02415 [Arthrobacter sp. JZ12]
MCAVLLLSVVLVGCFPSNPEEKYWEAIAAVDGVEDVGVEWNRNGVGDSTRITVSTSTNDQAELRDILDRSLRAFIETTEQGEETTLSYRVLSQDQTIALDPADLGVVLYTLTDIRRYYGLE